MSGPGGETAAVPVVARFRELLSVIGPWLPAVAFLGRMPAAMCPIGTLLLVGTETGSIGDASLVSGALALGEAAGGPVVGRLADRRGQRTVILAASLVNATAILALVTAAVTGRPVVLQIAFAAVVGLTVPQVGPLARGRWLSMVRGKPGEERLIGSALSFDGTADEVSFTLGPAVTGVLAALVAPAPALVLAAVLVGVCGTLFAIHPSAPAGSGPPAGGRGHASLMSPALALLMCSMSMQGLLFGSVQAGVSAMATHLGSPGAAGLLYALLGGVSALAGVATAALPARIGLPLRLRLATAAMLATSLPLLPADSIGSLALAVPLVGAAIAPHIITVFGLTERIVARERIGEAMALLVSSVLVAQSVGVMVAGRLADAYGPGAPSVVSCAATATAALVAAATATSGRYPPAAPALPVPHRTGPRAASPPARPGR
ncbi:MFS transporter [Streptomyces sp. NPDC006649]|uniref:MFS transporter n=1 Tax=Streptomyces sp. NPDC006649 TaxID=3156896 RepID=UPI00339DCFF1